MIMFLVESEKMTRLGWSVVWVMCSGNLQLSAKIHSQLAVRGYAEQGRSHQSWWGIPTSFEEAVGALPRVEFTGLDDCADLFCNHLEHLVMASVVIKTTLTKT